MSDQEVRNIPMALQRLMSTPRDDPRMLLVLENLTAYYHSTPEHSHWAQVCERLLAELAKAAGFKRRSDNDPAAEDSRYNCALRLDGDEDADMVDCEGQ